MRLSSPPPLSRAVDCIMTRLQDLLLPDGSLNDCWVLSDTHLWHENIIKYAGRPADHHDRILSAWREMIAPGDLLLHLGDIAMGRRHLLEELASSLPGRKLLIRGNHDRQSVAFYAACGFTLVSPFSGKYQGWEIRFTHRPDPEWVRVGNRRLNAHGHIHEKLMNDLRFLNLSVEQTGYQPVRLHAVLDGRIKRLADA